MNKYINKDMRLVTEWIRSKKIAFDIQIQRQKHS